MPLTLAALELKERLRTNVFLSALALALGLALGAVFFYAGLQKHFAPGQFAEAVLAYRLLPQSLVGYVAAVLPWVELTAGFFLTAGYILEILGRLATAMGFASGHWLTGGIKRRSCLLLLMALAFVFAVVIGVSWARGLRIDCGCGLFFQRQVGAAAILENLLIMAVSAILYWWEYPGE